MVASAESVAGAGSRLLAVRFSWGGHVGTLRFNTWQQEPPQEMFEFPPLLPLMKTVYVTQTPAWMLDFAPTVQQDP